MFEKICVGIVCIVIGIVACVIILFVLDTWITNTQFRKNMKIGDIGSVKMGDAGYCVCVIHAINEGDKITIEALRQVIVTKRRMIYSEKMVVTE
ncbi:MAG: hypothetical protein WC359_13495 [Dehalococcoidia bacterium]|jgi:hypothetical protein